MAHRIATQWYSGLALVIAGALLVLALNARSPEAPAADAASSVPAISGMSLSSVAACPVSGDLVGDGNPAGVAAVLCPQNLPNTNNRVEHDR
jgi:hypothetical protein